MNEGRTGAGQEQYIRLKPRRRGQVENRNISAQVTNKVTSFGYRLALSNRFSLDAYTLTEV
jgi:hypothetical protein